MATVATTTAANPFLYPQVTKVDRDPVTGNLYVAALNASGNIDLHVSTNNGGTWAVATTLVRSGIVELGSLFVTNRYRIHLVFRTNTSSQDRIYWTSYRLDTATWETEVLTGAPGNGGVAGAVHDGLDVISVIVGVQEYVAIAAGTTLGGSHGVTLYGVHIPTTGVPYYTNNVVYGTRQWLVAGSGRVGPTLELDHAGDGKSSGNPHLWIAWGRTKLYLVKSSWSGGYWSGPAAYTTLTAGTYPAQNSISGRFDGTRLLAVVPNPAATSTVLLVERDRANSVTTTRTSTTHPTGVIRSCTLSYNASTGDTRIYAVGTSTAVAYYIDYVRATATWSAWNTVTATAVLGTPPENYSVRRGTYGNGRYDVLTAHSGAPNTIVHTQQSIAYVPSVPTWQNTEHGVAANVANVLDLDWSYNSPDPGDTQGSYALRRQIGAGAFAWFRASDSTWQATEQQNVSATSYRQLAAAWGADSDGAHSYAVKVWSAGGLPSVYSDVITFIPSAQANPTFTAPAAAAVITSDTVTVSWTVSQQSAYRLTLATNPGGVVLWDSGWQTSAATTVVPAYVLADGTGWTVGLTTRNTEGLASTTVTRNFTVDYIEPATPTVVVTPLPSSGVMQVAVTNPAPSGGQPALAYGEVWRRPTGGAAATEVRVATGLTSGATVQDFRAVGGVAYQYRARAVGVNGTSVYGAWTA